MNTNSLEEATKMISLFENIYKKEISYAFITRKNSQFDIYLSSSYNKRILQKNNSIIDQMNTI